MKKLCEIKEILSAIYSMENSIKKNYNLTINEAICLCCLDEGSNSPGNIAQEMGISLSRMSRVLSSLENKGFITRAISSEDRRKMFFSLNKKGKSKLDSLQNSDIEFPDDLVK
ncbi:MAG: MarR family winged helix-turn-helix transcriptional regulator [Spirochaetia bacterium]